MNRVRQSTLSRLSVCITACLLCGCGEIAKLGLKGALRHVGATVVEESSEENLRAMFDAANDACPRKIDLFTTLEEIVMIDDSRVEFRYVVSDEGTRCAAHLDKRSMRRAAVDHMRGNPMAVAIAERDLSIEHIYEDSSGNHILSYTINRAVLSGDLDPIGAERSNRFHVTPAKSAASERVVVEPKPLSPPAPAAESTVGPPAKDEVQPRLGERGESLRQRSEEMQQRADEIRREVEDKLGISSEVKPPLPQNYKPRRTRDNPAGVRENPYVD